MRGFQMSCLWCSLLLASFRVVVAFQSTHEHRRICVVQHREKAGIFRAMRPIFSKFTPELESTVTMIEGRRSSEELDENEAAMSRRLFFSQSFSAAVAVSVITSTPVDAIEADRTQIQSQLISAAKLSDETLIETISGFFSGAALTTTKTFVKYPLDTATVRLQMPNTQYSIFNLVDLFDGSFRGISLPLLSNIPGGAVFFAIKDATKSVCKESGMPKWMATCISVGVANFPYWLIRNPSEVLKTRQQISTGNETAFDALQSAFNSGNTTESLKDLYSGYWENIIYAYPADVIKFLAYERLSSGKKNLPATEAALYGAFSTAIAQFCTTPLDVVRNRIMAGKGETQGGFIDQTKSSYVDKCVRLAREEGLSGLFAGASPRVGKAFLSGAIQFATYEETKRSIREALGKI